MAMVGDGQTDTSDDRLSYWGSQSHECPKQLWANLPAVSCEQATFSTDQDVVYQGVIPAARQKAMTKNARKTHHIERFNTTLRPRVSRWVRQPLACSKNVENHIGAMRYCICYEHLTSAAA
jgi:insertion element IS1 protein InsB